jgi:hypothetical protein
MEALAFSEMGEQLVRDLDKELPARRSKRWRCRTELKTNFVSYAKVCREQGVPLPAESASTTASALAWPDRTADARPRTTCYGQPTVTSIEPRVPVATGL